jgi:hypothetical protein
MPTYPRTSVFGPIPFDPVTVFCPTLVAMQNMHIEWSNGLSVTRLPRIRFTGTDAQRASDQGVHCVVSYRTFNDMRCANIASLTISFASKNHNRSQIWLTCEEEF